MFIGHPGTGEDTLVSVTYTIIVHLPLAITICKVISAAGLVYKLLPFKVPAMPVLVLHYDDVIITTIASQITSLTVVYSTVYSDADQRKLQSSASLAFVGGIHRDRWSPRTKGQLRGKCFHLMTSSCLWRKSTGPPATDGFPSQKGPAIHILLPNDSGLLVGAMLKTDVCLMFQGSRGIHDFVFQRSHDAIMCPLVSLQWRHNGCDGVRWIPAQMASNAENVSIWWGHHDIVWLVRRHQSSI